MIKEKLMKALKTAVDDYNGGMSPNMAVACAAEAWDFNEKQAERLVEMMNTSIALSKQAESEDPAGTCELASKEKVAKILFDGCETKKEASDSDADYSFYSSNPSKTNLSIEARAAGSRSMMKAASAHEDKLPKELDVSQRSLYKVIEGDISMLKSAAAAADDVVRNLKMEANSLAVKIAKKIEHPYADKRLADMFKAACQSKKAVDMVSEYSTKVEESTGGKYSLMNVFDAAPAEDILKQAEQIEEYLGSVGEYEKKRDFYLSKAAEAENEMLEAVGLKKTAERVANGLADFFLGIDKKASSDDKSELTANDETSETGMCMKIAEALKDANVDSESVAKLVEELEKEAAMTMAIPVTTPSVEEAHRALTSYPGVDSEKKRVLNVRRAILLADLMSNDPIIRDADPDTVVEAYKTMVMTSPRVSLDKAQARAFLRGAVNSVAISPADAKIIADVDKGMSLSNIDKLTAMDSSIKDSNV